MGSEVDRIATALMKHLHRAFNVRLDGKRIALARFYEILNLITTMTNLLLELRHTLLSHNSTVVVTRIFGRISSMHADENICGLSIDTSPSLTKLNGAMLLVDDEPLEIESVITACVDYLDEASRTSGGFTWVIQVIRSGIISATLRSACRGSEEVDHQLLVDCVLTILQPHLVY